MNKKSKRGLKFERGGEHFFLKKKKKKKARTTCNLEQREYSLNQFWAKKLENKAWQLLEAVGFSWL
jgi:hypothetical protein